MRVKQSFALWAVGLSLLAVGCSGGDAGGGQPGGKVALKDGAAAGATGSINAGTAEVEPGATSSASGPGPNTDPATGTASASGPSKDDGRGHAPDKAPHVSDISAWKPTNVGATSIATKADAALAGLQNVVGIAQITMQLPTGDARATSNLQIKSPSVFMVNYPVVKRGEPESVHVMADGKTRRIVPGNISKPVAAKTPPVAPGQLISEWPTGAPRHAIAALTERRAALTEYVKALSADKEMKVTTAERTFRHEGKMMKVYRILVTRTGQAALKKGAQTVEMVFDSQVGLPVMIDARVQPLKGKPTHVLWTASWKSNQKIDTSKFPISRS